MTPRCVFASADYDGLELRTMAQACINLVGESSMAQVLNSDQPDVHAHLAIDILETGLSYDQFQAQLETEKAELSAHVKKLVASGIPKVEAITRAGLEVPHPADDARQTSKVCNFGFPGGLGAAKLVLFARKGYGVILDEDRARKLKRAWLGRWREFNGYFKACERMLSGRGRDARGALRQFYSGRVRGGASYTALCNSFFQGLGADATGHALFLVSRACYAETPCGACSGVGCAWCWGRGVSALFGCRLVNYVHDEFICEVPETRGHEAAHELVRIMIAGAAPYLPDVPATAKPVLMRYWSKAAKQVWENGRLMPWAA